MTRQNKKRSHKKRTGDLWNTRRESQIQTELDKKRDLVYINFKLCHKHPLSHSLKLALGRTPKRVAAII